MSRRDVFGVLTTASWVGVGVYTVFYGIDSTWKACGYLIIAVGVIRGFVLLRDWKKTKSRLRSSQWRAKGEQDE